MFYENKVYRSVGFIKLQNLNAGRIFLKIEYLNEPVECRGKPGKLCSSFLSFLNGEKLYCHTNLACEGLACLRPVQIKQI